MSRFTYFSADFFVTEKQTPQTFPLLECMHCNWLAYSATECRYLLGGAVQWKTGEKVKGDSKGQGMESSNGVCTSAHPNIPIRVTSNSSDVAKKWTSTVDCLLPRCPFSALYFFCSVEASLHWIAVLWDQVLMFIERVQLHFWTLSLLGVLWMCLKFALGVLWVHCLSCPELY